MSAILFGFLAALANASQALISKGLTARAPARQLVILGARSGSPVVVQTLVAGAAVVAIGVALILVA